MSAGRPGTGRDRVEIAGGADPETAAAIAAVIRHLLDIEDQRRTEPITPPRQSQWVLAGRPRPASAPLPSHSYDADGWSSSRRSSTREPEPPVRG